LPGFYNDWFDQTFLLGNRNDVINLRSADFHASYAPAAETLYLFHHYRRQ
jgi:hypothetical protein